jgi:hypothetical protein
MTRPSARAGEDGDCTANDAGSILGTWLGLSKLDPKYSSALDPKATFVGTDYTFQKTIDMSTEAARAIVKYMGGSVTGTGDAERVSFKGIEGEDEGIREQAADGGRVDVAAVGRDPTAA